MRPVAPTGRWTDPVTLNPWQKIEKSEQEWREQLTPEQYEVTRKAGTERAFTGPYVDEKAEGMYRCVCCGTELFSSDTKFDSGTGWPSFTEPANLEHVELRPDNSLFMRRTEVVCKNCDAHLGPRLRRRPGRPGRPALLHQRLRADARREGLRSRLDAPPAPR